MAAAPSPPSPGDLHDDQVVSMLRSGAHSALLNGYFGEVEYRELCQLATLAAARFNPSGTRVFVLPGIMGSRLGAPEHGASNLLWLHPPTIAHGGLLQLAMPATSALRAVGVMLPGYLKLRLSLEIAGFRPTFHPFDWRDDLERLAHGLIDAIDRTEGNVLVVAHSMGGLVARIALGADRNGRIARLVQLGAPNAGSFAPLQALRAVYPTVRKIAALDPAHSAEELARRVFLTLPGLCQMLPGRLAAHPAEPDFLDPASWPADDLRPDPKLLARARIVRERMPPADERCTVIAGIGQETVVCARPSAGSLEYGLRCDGDGTVPLARAAWQGARTWYVPENHGRLTTSSKVLAGLVEILQSGSTRHLQSTAPVSSMRIERWVAERELRHAATDKVVWDALSLDSRRRILEPVISPEFSSGGGVM
jgi:pimeloyl-ACP methyl ester carboxylesterase